MSLFDDTFTFGGRNLRNAAISRDPVGEALREDDRLAAAKEIEWQKQRGETFRQGLDNANRISLANIAAQTARNQQATELTKADIDRRSHEGGINLAAAAQAAQAAQEKAEKAGNLASAAYQNDAFDLLGIPGAVRDSQGNIKESRLDLLRKDPAKLELFETHKGNLPALQGAYDAHNWWTTHGTPENISGFLDFAKGQGAELSPEDATLFRAQAGARDPEIRRIFGPAMETYVKTAPKPTFQIGGQKFSLSEAARRVGEGGFQP